MKNPKVYIIILNYNGWADTIECLESVLRNNYPNYQVIVIDNNSPNNSMEHIKAWAEGKLDVWVNPKHSLRHLSFPPVKKPIPFVYYTRKEAEKGGNKSLEDKLKRRISKSITTTYPLIFIQTGENLGYAGGNNVGIKYALEKDDCKYIWILNNDTVIEKNSLLEMVKVIDSNNRIGIVGSKLLRYDIPTTLQTLCGTTKMTWKNAGKGNYLFSNEEDKQDFNKIFELDSGYIVGASILIRKEVFEDIGLLDENYFMWAEDTDFCMRAIRNGWKLYCCGKSKIWHKEGASSGSGKMKKFLWRTSIRPSFSRFIITGYLDIRNHIYFVKKHWGTFHMWIYILGPNLKKVSRKILGILLFDDRKLQRIKLLLKGIIDGIIGKVGKPRELP